MNTIHEAIQSLGGRLTKTRKTIINVLLQNHCLLSKQELAKKLEVKNIKPNRSTIYRELRFLTRNNIIIKSAIAGVDYYEIPKDHHHHLVCMNCNSIDKVEAGDNLEKQEKSIEKNNKFKIINHSLEFYGLCNKCQKLATKI